MALTRLGTSAYTTLDATKLSGALPAISGASLTGISTDSGLASQQVFTSSGTWTKPTGITKVKVIVIGGGGGGSCNAGYTVGTGGGSARNSGGNGTAGGSQIGGAGGENTGGGGGGASWSYNGGAVNGGSGIVIVRWA